VRERSRADPCPVSLLHQRHYATLFLSQSAHHLRSSRRGTLGRRWTAIAARLHAQFPLHPLHCATADAELCVRIPTPAATLPDGRFRGTGYPPRPPDRLEALPRCRWPGWTGAPRRCRYGWHQPSSWPCFQVRHGLNSTPLCSRFFVRPHATTMTRIVTTAAAVGRGGWSLSREADTADHSAGRLMSDRPPSLAQPPSWGGGARRIVGLERGQPG